MKGMSAGMKYNAARHAKIVDETTAAGFTYLSEVLNIAMVVRFTANIVKNLEMTQVILIFACWIGLPEWVWPLVDTDISIFMFNIKSNQMKKIKMFLLAVTMLVSSMAFGQDLTVTGIVRDSSTGEGVPFASLQIKGTMTGTSSDADGYYSISVPSDGVIIFSSVGYVTLEVPVAGKAQHDVLLNPDTEAIEETIVVAFGTATKESFTGSATVVKSDDIAKTQSTDATRALEGVVAGVQMTTASGSLGSKPQLIIRGVSSMSAGTDPLYVIDGIPYGSDFDMNNLNPADIESMTVLKDAASNALYGARGANGVIMITTKKAKIGDAVVNVDVKWGLNTKALKNYDYVTEPGQYYEMYYSALRNYYVSSGYTEQEAHFLANEKMVAPSTDTSAEGLTLGYNVYNVPEGQSFIGMNGKLNPGATLGRTISYNGKDYLLTPDNWLDNAYHNSVRQEYNVSVSGTTGNASVLASFGYLKNNGIIDGSNMYRYTARVRTDYQAKEWLKFGANVSYTNYNWNNGNSDEGSSASTGNVFAIANQVAPIYPLFVRDAEGKIMTDKYGFDVYDYGTGENAGMIRPLLGNSNALQAAQLDKSNSEGNAFNGTAYAEAKFLKDFTFTFNAGVGFDEMRGTSVSNMYYGQFAPTGGMIGKSHGRSFSVNLQQLLNWNRNFSGHNVSLLLGHESYNSKGYSLSASKSQMFSMENDELNGAVVDGKSASSSRSEYISEGYFARAQYDFMNRIFVSASYRRDASTRFHPDHRWGNFWSFGGGWIIDQESWFPKTSWIDMLKLKASIGSQGNDSIGNYLYTDTFYLSNNNGLPSISFAQKGNENITWETNTNFNAGVDFEFLKARVTGSFEYFYRMTSDMLFWFTVPASLGYGGYYDNIGDMRNHGIEFSTNVNIMRKRNFDWNAYLNFTHYTNKITMLPEERKTRNVEGYEGYASGTRFYGEGLPFNTFYLQKFAGVDDETGQSLWYKDVKDADGNVTRTTTATYSEATQYLCDDPTPDLYGGFGTSLSFYGFDMSVAFTYSIGGLAYDSGYAGYMGSPVPSSLGSNFHKDILNAWTPDNKSSEIPRFQYQDQYTAASSDRFLVDASYLNFQNAQIGYTFPERVVRKLNINKIRVYLACDNIVYWSYRNGLDPRQSLSGSTSNAMNSPVRTISGGLNLTF